MRSGNIRESERVNLLLADTLAVFANLEVKDVRKFRAGSMKVGSREGLPNVVQHFLPDVCWSLPQLALSGGQSPLDKSIKYAWQEIQLLIGAAWSQELPFYSYEAADRITITLDLYSRVSPLEKSVRKYLHHRNRLFKRNHQESANANADAFELGYLSAEVLNPSTLPFLSEFLELNTKLLLGREIPVNAIAEDYATACTKWILGSESKTSLCRRAIAFLVFNSWRAKICRTCRKRYIARKQQSRFCSRECFVRHRRESNKQSGKKWWDKNGKLRRREREEANRRSRGSR
jgi:hypothetical protein